MRPTSSAASEEINALVSDINFSVIELDIIKPHINWITYKNIKITAIGELLFNEGYILFIGATLLLFVAMIGAIILTLGKIEQKRHFVNNQHVVN